MATGENETTSWRWTEKELQLPHAKKKVKELVELFNLGSELLHINEILS